GFYRLAAEAFGGLDWQVVMSIGRFFDPAELGVLPSNVEVHEWVPQRAVLEHASAFVTHAGMGSTMEGLYYGVPLIAVPQAVDQPLNAARIADLGLGVHLPKEEVSVPALREALCTVTADPAIGDRLDAMRR
ncbi:glycosyl transferase, partial [Virgibacillus profundi]